MTNTITIEQQAAKSPSKAGVAVWAERLLWLSWVPLVLFTVFFTSIPDIHNGVHPIRHSTTIVQCH